MHIRAGCEQPLDGSGVALTAAESRLDWHTSLDDALEAAETSGRPVLAVTLWKDGVCIHTLMAHDQGVDSLAVLPEQPLSHLRDLRARWELRICAAVAKATEKASGPPPARGPTARHAASPQLCVHR